MRAFAATRDEAAFAALVGRHGPLVLGVCRRVYPPAADDACSVSTGSPVPSGSVARTAAMAVAPSGVPSTSSWPVVTSV